MTTRSSPTDQCHRMGIRESSLGLNLIIDHRFLVCRMKRATILIPVRCSRRLQVLKATKGEMAARKQAEGHPMVVMEVMVTSLEIVLGSGRGGSLMLQLLRSMRRLLVSGSGKGEIQMLRLLCLMRKWIKFVSSVVAGYMGMSCSYVIAAIKAGICIVCHHRSSECLQGTGIAQIA